MDALYIVLGFAVSAYEVLENAIARFLVSGLGVIFAFLFAIVAWEEAQKASKRTEVLAAALSKKVEELERGMDETKKDADKRTAALSEKVEELEQRMDESEEDAEEDL
jgi:acetyl/propionyl-CoA carboxylase alpha subunit